MNLLKKGVVVLLTLAVTLFVIWKVDWKGSQLIQVSMTSMSIKQHPTITHKASNKVEKSMTWQELVNSKILKTNRISSIRLKPKQLSKESHTTSNTDIQQATYTKKTQHNLEKSDKLLKGKQNVEVNQREKVSTSLDTDTNYISNNGHSSIEELDLSNNTNQISINELQQFKEAKQVSIEKLDWSKEDLVEETAGILQNDVLDKYADSNRTVVISLTDHLYIDITVNFYVSSLRKHNISNYLFISSDNRTCPFLRKFGINCFSYDSGIIADKDTGFRTPSYYLKTNFKIRIVKDILEMGYTVLLADIDIIMFKNPFPYLYLNKYDIQIQHESQNMVNVGFYLARPTNNLLLAFRLIWNYIISQHVMASEMEQDIMNRYFNKLKSKQQLNIHVLDLHKFQNGCAFFMRPGLMFGHQVPNDTVMIHCNCMGTSAAKIYRFKENFMWYLNKNGYYTDSTRKYLMYDNPVIDSVRTDTFKYEYMAFRTALYISSILNRTLILPSFTCPGTGNIQKCPFNSYFHVQTFDQYFENKYREHVFLQNTMVPETVKNSKSETLFIENKLLSRPQKASFQNPSNLKHFKPKSPDFITPSELLTWFSSYNDKSILVFHSLFGVNLQVPSDSDDFVSITEKVQLGIKRSDYMQMNHWNA